MFYFIDSIESINNKTTLKSSKIELLLYLYVKKESDVHFK